MTTPTEIIEYVRENFGPENEDLVTLLLHRYFRKKGLEEKEIPKVISNAKKWYNEPSWKKIDGNGSLVNPTPIFSYEDRTLFRTMHKGKPWEIDCTFDICFKKYGDVILPVDWIIFALCGYSIDRSFPAKVTILDATEGTIIRFITGSGNPGSFATQIDMCYEPECEKWYFRYSRVGLSYTYFYNDAELASIVICALMKLDKSTIEGWDNLENVSKFVSILTKCPTNLPDIGYYLLWGVFMEKWTRCDNEYTCEFEHIKICYIPGEDLKVFKDSEETNSYFYNMRSAIHDRVTTGL